MDVAVLVVPTIDLPANNSVLTMKTSKVHDLMMQFESLSSISTESGSVIYNLFI